MKLNKLILVFALSLFGTLSLTAQDSPNVFVDDNNVALKGYDLVSYFTKYTAERGNKNHAVEHEGVTYYFSSEANKAKFTENPNKYKPEYGGWCAYAIGAAKAKFPVDPETFKIVDGKLYLFFNDFNKGEPFNTIIPWNEKEAELRVAADKNWGSMK